jgi:hypothetical protein
MNPSQLLKFVKDIAGRKAAAGSQDVKPNQTKPQPQRTGSAAKRSIQIEEELLDYKGNQWKTGSCFAQCETQNLVEVKGTCIVSAKHRREAQKGKVPDREADFKAQSLDRGVTLDKVLNLSLSLVSLSFLWKLKGLE